MNTQNLNITPGNGDSDNKSEKSAKAKKVAGTAAQFAGASGLGAAAGTMSANAMNTPDDNPDVIIVTMTPESQGNVEGQVITPEEINPNDIIIIEDGEDVEIDDDNNGDIAIIDVDNYDVDPNLNDIEPCMYGGPEGWDNFDDPTSLLADDGNIDMDSDPDILDDILA